jgi:hypothetical protein
MRLFLRVIAVLAGLQIANTILLVWRMVRLGSVGVLARTGIFVDPTMTRN